MLNNPSRLFAKNFYSQPTSTLNKQKIIYIGKSMQMINTGLLDYNYEVLNFNLSFPADLWLKHNSFSSSSYPAAIICDLELPDSDAFTFFKNLNENQSLKKIPFIILSKEYSSFNKIKAFELGVDDFYPNTVSSEDLHERITILNEIKHEKDKNLTVNEKKRIPVRGSKIIFEKRIFDIVLSGLLILLLSPLFVIISIFILIESRGGVIYISKRVGTGYQIFNFYKFRTMKVGADKQLKGLLHLNQYTKKGKGSPFVKLNNDPRITYFGKFLRQTSLDELPQLFNVFIGDMSLVGNRPLPLYEAEQLTTDMWAKRFLAPAGITGLWQVTKRGHEEMSEEERINLDIAYADRSSFWFDIKILIKTLPAVFQKAAV